MKKYLVLLALLGTLSGCSATTLRCGTAEGDSYVELISVPQDIAGTARHLTELCSFSLDSENEK